MLLGDRSDIIKLVRRLRDEINESDLMTFWSDFGIYPFALYNRHEIYLAEHPLPPEDFREEGGVYIGQWRNRFSGNRSTTFADHEVVIQNLDHLSSTISFDQLYSCLIHKIFHSFQKERGFNFGNGAPLKFLNYPITEDNLTLRIKEREELLKAAFATNDQLRRYYTARFVALRKERREDMQDNLDYELVVEGIEGTATYVEYMARLSRSNLPREFIIGQYGTDLAIYPHDLSKFNDSCSSSGMFICLLLDQHTTDWQDKFVESGQYLYDFFLKTIF